MIWDSLERRLMGVLRRLVALDRRLKFAALLWLDAGLCVIATWVAFSLRLGEWDLLSRPVLTVIVASVAAWFPIAFLQGIYRSIVRYIGARTIARIAGSCIIMAMVLSVFFFFGRVAGVPRTIAVIQPMVFASLLMTSRILAQYILFDVLNRQDFSGKPSRVLIFGAGSAGQQLAASLRHEAGMWLCGFIDDDERLSGQRLNGVKIFHSKNLSVLIQSQRVDTVLLALPGISRQEREQTVLRFADIGVKVLTLPAIGDLVSGSVSVSDLREVQITDLLGREPVPPNHLLLHRTISDRNVMITGAGGSIGSELCRQIGALNPALIVMVEMTEHALYLIESELREAHQKGEINPATQIVAELGDITDEDTARRLFDRWRPGTVFHAAAYKHVPLVEENVIAGLRNNVLGTLRCAIEARRVDTQYFILISTDKAVRPTNVMGASKRVCELILQALASEGGRTRFTMVRFGNVLGSSGSVVPRFQQQIKAGGPVTLTHRNVTRYFMTIPEAAQLVIQAGAMAEGGEVFVLDMGQPIRIYDMARTMVHLSGLSVRDDNNPDGDIEIREVGLRKGEKLYEELLIGASPLTTTHPRIMRATEDRLTWPNLSAKLELMESALRSGDRINALALLSELVPEYVGRQPAHASAA